MAAAEVVAGVALGRQQSLRLPAYRVVSASWGHVWIAGGTALIVAATVSTLGAIAARAEEKLGPDAQGRIDVLRLEDLPPSFRERVLSTGWRLDES